MCHFVQFINMELDCYNFNLEETLLIADTAVLQRIHSQKMVKRGVDVGVLN